MKVITGKVRFSFLNWATPKLNELSKKEEYSTEILVPKTDTETVNKLKAAMKDAAIKKFGDKMPPKMKNPLRDGDTETKASGEPLPEYYKGHYFIRTKSNDQPGVIDPKGNPIKAANDFVSGDYGRASITAFGYSQAGSNGVSFWLGNLQLLEKGEPFGSKSSASDDFGVKSEAAADFAETSDNSDTMPF